MAATDRIVHLTSVDATSTTVSAPPLYSTYCAVVAKGGSATARPVGGDGDVDND